MWSLKLPLKHTWKLHSPKELQTESGLLVKASMQCLLQFMDIVYGSGCWYAHPNDFSLLKTKPPSSVCIYLEEKNQKEDRLPDSAVRASTFFPRLLTELEDQRKGSSWPLFSLLGSEEGNAQKRVLVLLWRAAGTKAGWIAENSGPPPPHCHLSCFLCAGTGAHAHMHMETKRQTPVLFFRHYPYFILFFEMGAHLTSWPKLTTQTMLDGQWAPGVISPVLRTCHNTQFCFLLVYFCCCLSFSLCSED